MVALLASLAAAPSLADGDVAQYGSLDEITVSAERRDSTLQKTPISITAISGPELQAQGIADVDRIIQQVPGVSMNSMGVGRTSFDMRGLTSGGGTSPTVGFYLDDIPLTSNTSPFAAAGKAELDPNLYDLQRVEVLRGPQGTLYGASSMGGDIRLITNQPDPTKFAAGAQVTGSFTDGNSRYGFNNSLNGMLNLPLIENILALRIVATDKYDDGYIDRIVLANFPLPNANGTRGNVLAAPVQTVHPNDNSDRIKDLRLTLLYQPIDGLSITPSVFYQRLEVCCALGSYDVPPGPPTFAHYQPFDTAETSDQNFSLYSLRVKYDLGFANLESTTSQLDVNSSALEDESEEFYVAIGPPPSGYYPPNGSNTESHWVTQSTEELRLASKDRGPWSWITGAFYSRFTDHQEYLGLMPDYVSILGTNLFIQDTERDLNKEKAVFGELSYQLLPEWKLTGGLRYYSYDFSFTRHTIGFLGQPDESGPSSASGVLPKATLTYTPKDNLLLYTTASKGFRPGGPNFPLPSTCGPSLKSIGISGSPDTFTPDSVWNYELGEKFRTPGGRITADGALFYLKWSNVQQGITLSCGDFFTDNVGEAISKGGELEITGKVTTNLELRLSGGYTDAYLKSLPIPQSPAVGLVIGQQLPDVPKTTWSAALSHVLPLAGGYDVNTLLTERFVGGENDFYTVPFPDTYKPAYHVMDLRLGLKHDTWSVTAFADNLLNSHGVVGIDRAELANTTEFARLIPLRPLTIGLTANYAY